MAVMKWLLILFLPVLFSATFDKIVDFNEKTESVWTGNLEGTPAKEWLQGKTAVHVNHVILVR